MRKLGEKVKARTLRDSNEEVGTIEVRSRSRKDSPRRERD